ncbi:MAG: hypothetical protein ACRBHB_07220 [Arenicella sp.]
MSDNIYNAPEAELLDEVKQGEYGSMEIALSGRYNFQIKSILSEAWEKTKGSKRYILVGLLLYIVIYMAISVLGAMMFGNGVLGGFVIPMIGVLASFPIIMGAFIVAIRKSMGVDSGFDALFNLYSKVAKIFGLYIVMSLLILLGFICLVLPGIYLSVAYLMAMPLLVEKNMGIWEALETSRKSITKRWFKHFGFLLLTSLIALIAMLPLGIGLIWAAPMLMIAYAVLYRNMFGVDSKTLS